MTTTASALFHALDMPDEQRLMVVLGIMQMMPELFEDTVHTGKLVLIRGIPGSGKTTMARSDVFNGFEHFEADMFFTDASGVYRYEREKIKEAHEWCQSETRKALSDGKRVVVSNTFTRMFEMMPYFEMAKELGIKVTTIVATGDYGSVHNVSKETIEKMRNRFEEIKDAGGEATYYAASACYKAMLKAAQQGK